MWRRRWVLIPFLMLLMTVVAWLVWWYWTPGRAFDPVAWHDEAQVEQGVRLGMADRLVARGTLMGKTRAEVIDLLGEPSGSGYFAHADLKYWLGRERSYFSIDSEWLVVRLGADGRVIEYRIVHD